MGLRNESRQIECLSKRVEGTARFPANPSRREDVGGENHQFRMFVTQYFQSLGQAMKTRCVRYVEENTGAFVRGFSDGNNEPSTCVKINNSIRCPTRLTSCVLTRGHLA